MGPAYRPICHPQKLSGAGYGSSIKNSPAPMAMAVSTIKTVRIGMG
jgi:hypothetical protein